MKPLWKVVQIVRYNWVLVAKDIRTIRWFPPQCPSGEPELNVVLNQISHLKIGKIQKFLW